MSGRHAPKPCGGGWKPAPLARPGTDMPDRAEAMFLYLFLHSRTRKSEEGGMPVPRLAKWNILRLCPRLCRSSVNVVFHKSEMPNTSPGAAGRWLFDRLYFNWLKYKLNYFQKEALENVLLFWGKRKSERGAPNSADKNFGRYRFSPMTTVKSALCMERRSTANVFLQFMNFYQKRGCHGRSG